MAKVETYIEVNVKMNLKEARDLRDELGANTGQKNYQLFSALDDALNSLPEQEVFE